MNHHIYDETGLFHHEGRDSSMNICADGYLRYPISRFSHPKAPEIPERSLKLPPSQVATSKAMKKKNTIIESHNMKRVCKYNIQAVRVPRQKEV